jgi:cytochrome bd ubiquinol oxidase subunit I
MIGSGMLMILISLVTLFLFIRKRLKDKQLFLKVLTLSILLPYIANSTGWILTEVSRTPCIVFGLLKLEQAVSPNVSAIYVLTSIIVYTIVYSIFIVVDISLMIKFAKQSPLESETDATALKGMKEGSLWI